MSFFTHMSVKKVINNVFINGKRDHSLLVNSIQSFSNKSLSSTCVFQTNTSNKQFDTPIVRVTRLSSTSFGRSICKTQHRIQSPSLPCSSVNVHDLHYSQPLRRNSNLQRPQYRFLNSFSSNTISNSNHNLKNILNVQLVRHFHSLHIINLSIKSNKIRSFLHNSTMFLYPINIVINKAGVLPKSFSTANFSLFSKLTEDILKSKIPSEITSKASEQNTNDLSRGENIKKEKGKKDSSGSSWFSSKNAWKLGLLSLGVVGISMCGNLIFIWGTPQVNSEGVEIIDEFSILPKWQAYPRRAWKEFNFFKTMIQEPSSMKLLPDPVKEPYYQPPYTLVLELSGVLVHPDWTLSTGWRFKKRPAVEYFLQQVGPPLFEVVIYTREQGFTAFPIIDGLDPNGYVCFRLFRDATRYIGGEHVKDLDCLNRDLSKVIIVDCEPAGYKLHPRNAVPLPSWKGDDEDRTLIQLAAFLRTIATSGIDDVRPVLEHYSQFDKPLEVFMENQRRLQEQEESQTKLSAENKSPFLNKGFGFGRRR